MNKNQLQRYRQSLLTLAKRLRVDLQGVADEAMRTAGGESSGSLSDAPIHIADLGTDAFEQEVSLSLLANDEHILEDIAAAWQRIEAGTFGVCTECGKPIGDQRLEAVPYTPHCLECARAFQEEQQNQAP